MANNNYDLELQVFETLNQNHGLTTDEMKEVLQRVKSFEANAFASMMQHADASRTVGLMYLPILLLIQFIWINKGHDINDLYSFIFGEGDLGFAPKGELIKVMSVGENIPNYTHVFNDGSRRDFYIPSLKFVEVVNRYTFVAVKPSLQESEIIKNILYVLNNEQFKGYIAEYNPADVASIMAVKEQCYGLLNAVIKTTINQTEEDLHEFSRFNFCMELVGWWCIGAVIGTVLSGITKSLASGSVGQNLHA